MKRKGKGVGGFPVIHRISRAANDDFVDGAKDPDQRAPRRGWDPYEVWRVRVRESAVEGAEREGDPPR